MSTHRLYDHIADPLDRFMALQRNRFARTLTRRANKIHKAYRAAHSEDVLTDALLMTRRGGTYGGTTTVHNDD